MVSKNLFYYHPQMKFAKVMFSQVSVCPRGGVCPIPCWDTPPRTKGRHSPITRDRHSPLGPEADTPLGPEEDTPSPEPKADTPGQTSPWADTPLDKHPIPPPQCMLGYGQQVGGTHPNGMHSCLVMLLSAQNVGVILSSWRRG